MLSPHSEPEKSPANQPQQENHPGWCADLPMGVFTAPLVFPFLKIQSDPEILEAHIKL